MKSLKKFFTFILCLIMILSLHIPSLAADNALNKGPYIITKPVPNEAVQHTRKTIGNLLADLYSLDSVSIGKPFTVEGHSVDLYYFLVYNEKKLVGNYRVFLKNDGNYSGIFSESPEWLNEIEYLQTETSENNPAKIVVGDYEDVYAITSNSIIPIIEDPYGNTTNVFNSDELTLSSQNEYEIVDVSEEITFDIPLQTFATNSNYLQIGWDETQGSLPWCSAYATASICRYVTGKSLSQISARSIMEWTFPDLTYTELKKEGLSMTNAIKYGEEEGLSPIRKKSTLTWSAVQKEIDADRPIYFAFDNITTGKINAHAMVCRGYGGSSGDPFYSIWNPWNRYYERVYASDDTYFSEAGEEFEYAETIYNWG